MPHKNGPIAALWIVILACLIYYQLLITLIFLFRFNVFILLIEITLLFFALFGNIWRY